MTATKLLHSREAYTFFNLLEDFGGFIGSLIMLCNLFVSSYSQLVYENSISRELTLQTSTFSAQSKSKSNAFVQKFQRADPKVDSSDIATLSSVFKKTQAVSKVSFWKTLFCFRALCCKKDRQMRLRERTITVFENSLDIRQLVTSQVNLHGLMKVLFSK